MKVGKTIVSVVLVCTLLVPTLSLGGGFAHESSVESTVSTETSAVLFNNMK